STLVLTSHQHISSHLFCVIISTILLVHNLPILLTLRAGNRMVKQSTLFIFHPRPFNSYHLTSFILGPMPGEEILAKSLQYPALPHI
ncbi:MAG: hypothetical protein ACK56F_04040, partial [bacterium]